ncbi:MAG TPA: acyl-ACP thioesterase domain-containing protein [Candidatus Limnocylindrales bacterium]|jgi:acyl-ACP thioesterase|nr:acyl-ACP thioesterase domain-containing protein [Candidatus Limnocylindrales bacterium]
MTDAPAPPLDTDRLVHEATYRVRFDEAGPDGLMRTSALLRYAQDVAWLHSTARGFDRDWYSERQLTWLVRAAELEVLRPIRMGTMILSRTAVVGQRRVWARRRGEFLLDDGTLAGWVHTDWVMIDSRGALTRIPAIFAEEFKIPEMTGQIGRVTLPPTPANVPVHAFAARPHELDPMNHVNNAVYLDWLEEAILGATQGDSEGWASEASAAIPRRYRLEYAMAADAGATMTDAAWRDEGGWAYRLTASDGTELFRARLEPDPGRP